MDKMSVLRGYHSRLIALERHSALTAEAYGSEVRRLLAWMEESGLELQGVDSSKLTDYLELRRQRDNLDSRSVAKGISAIRSFFRYAVDEGLCLDNPAAALEPPRKGRRLPAVLPREAVEELLSTIDIQTPQGLRDRALFEFVYSAGLRISEAVGLNLADLFFKERIVRLLGKGNKERLVPFGGEAAHWLTQYIAQGRPQLAHGRTSPALFISRRGRRLSRKGIWKNYAETAKALGLSSKLHTLRHSYATELLAGGADLRIVQELLGHADLGTTQIYTHVDTALLRDNHRRYLPRLRGYTE